MPRWGKCVVLPGGGVAFIDGSTRSHRCSRKCGRAGPLQCDYPVGDGRTCDKYLCRQCAVRKGPNVDWCPDHPQP